MNKIDRNSIPEDFTLSLALIDGLPVLFFCGSMIIISKLFSNKLFLLGALLCFLAGLAKVLWKIIVVIKKKNIWFLFIQMRIIMPIGLLLMIISLLININRINIETILTSIMSFPVIIFFGIGIVGMLLMLIFAFTLNNKDIKANWIEQIINIIAQLSFLIGLLLI